MNVYIDTSAFLAVLNHDDDHHAEAKAIWCYLLDTGASLGTNSYVLVETVAVLQRRLGLDAVRTFFGAIYPLLEIVWVDDALMTLAIPLLLTANRTNLSMVDCTSFLVMQRLQVKKVFAFDRHFAEQGLVVLEAK